MLFFFSSTGNSSAIARRLSTVLGEKLFSIAEALKNSDADIPVSLAGEERLIFVFPIHAWGPALSISQFLSRWRPTDYNGQPAYAVCTCGDDCGRTDLLFGRMLKEQGIPLRACFSVQMPNTYILLPGFDTDANEVVRKKLAASRPRVEEIASAILRSDFSKPLYVAGSFACLKTSLVYPLFARWWSHRVKFHATAACVGCNLCASVCPSRAIHLINKRPVWTASKCVQCLACIHRCPKRAIEYGNATAGKGRYVLNEE